MRTVYQNIVANTPEGKAVQHDWWANDHQRVRQVISPNQSAPTELGPGSPPPWGQSPGPQYSASR